MDLVSLCLAGTFRSLKWDPFPWNTKSIFFNPALMYGHLSVIVSTVASLSAVNVSVISGMKFPFKGSPHAFNFNSCTSEFCFSFKKINMVPPTTLQSLSRHCWSLYTNSWRCIKPAFFFWSQSSWAVVFDLADETGFFLQRTFFFSYASLLKLMLPCRDNRVAAGQNMTEPHKLNTRKTDFIRFGKVIYVSEHVSLWQYLSVLDETTQSTIVQFITLFCY